MHMQHYFLLSVCLLSNLTFAMNKDCSGTFKDLNIKNATIYVILGQGTISQQEAVKKILDENRKKSAQPTNEVVNHEQQQGTKKNFIEKRKSKL